MTPLIKRGKPAFKRWLWKRVPQFEFSNDPSTPLTYTEGNIEYQPDRHFITDGGSIPPPLWDAPFVSLGPWDFPRAYPFHDSGFTYGGLYIRFSDDSEFRFTLLVRAQLNRLLCRMILADGGDWIDAKTVGAGLAIGSGFCWDERKQAENRERDGIISATQIGI